MTIKLKDLVRCIGNNPLYKNHRISGKECGVCNAYIYIPYSQELAKIAINDNDYYPFESQVGVHGGITYGDKEPCTISEFHCPYNRVLNNDEYTKEYICVGWDTNHLDDNDDKWNYRTVIEENERLAEQLVEVINKRLNL